MKLAASCFTGPGSCRAVSLPRGSPVLQRLFPSSQPLVASRLYRLHSCLFQNVAELVLHSRHPFPIGVFHLLFEFGEVEGVGYLPSPYMGGSITSRPSRGRPPHPAPAAPQLLSVSHGPAFPRMPSKWGHAMRSLWRLTSSTRQCTLEIHACGSVAHAFSYRAVSPLRLSSGRSPGEEHGLLHRSRPKPSPAGLCSVSPVLVHR